MEIDRSAHPTMDGTVSDFDLMGGRPNGFGGGRVLGDGSNDRDLEAMSAHA
ncbi:hypothetical protein KIN20_018413 [Parelaphostrongylus tenuis]|uniref:Uncharacterized protein n=1 Tax=Parelaphostrongylus tenuis TaxID=148309 RepID=A0AAD5N7G7_PARTN|nr:hypothetical protein KIN20_018413 [Parelaphostrongylus tenuis]